MARKKLSEFEPDLEKKHEDEKQEEDNLEEELVDDDEGPKVRRGKYKVVSDGYWLYFIIHSTLFSTLLSQ